MTVTTSLGLVENNAAIRRRRDLANFLINRRERAMPAAFGLPEGKRRRVRGLRREEVAELAEISSSWYTWLEQGRPIRVSAETLLRLARALQLDRDETEQLFILAEQAPPVKREKDRPTLPGLRELLGELEDWPAFSVCKRWDFLEWNQAASVLFGGLERLPVQERNMLWLLFTRPEFRKLYLDWERAAECTVNHFHANYHERLEEEQWVTLVRELERRSPEFRRMWQAHGVTRLPDWTKRMEHPVGGRLTFETLTLLPPGGDIRVILYRPADEETREGVRRLLRS